MSLVKEELIKGLINSGVKEVTKFKGNVRQDLTLFVDGDVFTIEPNAQIYSRPIGVHTAEFILVEAVNGKDKKLVELYPNTFAKSARECNSDGIFVSDAPIKSKGTACDMYRSFATQDDAMKAMADECAKGKKIKVTSSTGVQVRKFGSTTETRNTLVYDFDFVD